MAEDLAHFEHDTFFAIKDLDGCLLALIKAAKSLKDDKFPLEDDFRITYSDFGTDNLPFSWRCLVVRLFSGRSGLFQSETRICPFSEYYFPDINL